ncbi:UDP-N-acetylmuramoyl-L-alanyl-D-glutamate--2,6-diaminopimelate ligase [Hyphococcus flavus]|uniref:UDP-N-acetylmuramoyl-L-alanyl-D-glutamate--2,6-diaminopimelate ligase n=1 Tax=Hyphococcus flavus TaxID=1866326 RepID=A0AAF0CEL4_9PROT|nr:UDP-N-acetylmuramoyl-L-alanyl-D-glutamate--2,6-diaminopimelate ligase [Hyphococcus flavus]WDI30389.1 UDP-N-acetylmuramoyl-L-alanyl-D-glutamate--2,6-diaminopimelate ligase [Hyphococcus flavus]
MKLSELSGETFSPDPVIAGLTADSRAVTRGFLFAALPGVNFDGAKFIPQAEENGACAVLARPGVASRLPIVVDTEPRKRLSQMAARFYPRQPQTIAGITGTNGKTSTARFTAQIWQRLGKVSGSLGTLGAQAENYDRNLIHTTPDPVMLHQTLQEMADEGVTHLAMEVSSHGLVQNRADGVKFKIAAFTNITQDHLDYHASFNEYFAAKARLFDELVSDEGVVVVNADGEGAEEIVNLVKKRGLRVITTGVKGESVQITEAVPQLSGLNLSIVVDGKTYVVTTPLIGAFQAENVALAVGVAMASGAGAGDIIPLLEYITGAPGRMQMVSSINGAGVYVDYAHTPDAVATALKAIRPHAKGRVVTIIGAGGDRDKAKRPLMGAAAFENADTVIVTDDNPRNEGPAAIRKQVMEGCPDAQEIGDREEAIAAGVAMLKDGDVLLILGKGHETGQVVGDKILPFDDAEVASRAIANRMKELGR